MENNEYDEVEVFSVVDELEIGQVMAILKENNIPFVRKDDGAGSYMTLYMGKSYEMKRLFIAKKDYERVLELIAPFLKDEKDENSNQEQEIDDENKSEIEKYAKITRMYGILFVGIPIIVICIAMLIASIIF